MSTVEVTHAYCRDFGKGEKHEAFSLSYEMFWSVHYLSDKVCVCISKVIYHETFSKSLILSNKVFSYNLPILLYISLCRLVPVL